ncbi:MAG: TrmH family RNA methyltransferase, partial [Myxococcota bacterium]
AFEKDVSRAGLWEADLPHNAVLCFGNEDTGLSAEILEAAANVVAIPMFGINHSYPIAVAAGIAMAEWARRYYSGGRLVTEQSSQSIGLSDPNRGESGPENGRKTLADL